MGWKKTNLYKSFLYPTKILFIKKYNISISPTFVEFFSRPLSVQVAWEFSVSWRLCPSCCPRRPRCPRARSRRPSWPWSRRCSAAPRRLSPGTGWWPGGTTAEAAAAGTAASEETNVLFIWSFWRRLTRDFGPNLSYIWTCMDSSP